MLDHLGSVRDVTDDAGNVSQKYTYEPYGRIHWQKDAGYDNAWRFAQGYFDTDISHYKLGVRYYGFNQGRFTQFDPMAGKIADPVTLNKYQYANCDPANNTDPTGRSVQPDPALCIAVGVPAAVVAVLVAIFPVPFWAQVASFAIGGYTILVLKQMGCLGESAQLL